MEKKELSADDTLGATENEIRLTDEQRAAERAVGEANNAFSIDLYKAIKSQPGNLIVSPLSASTVLALVLQGAGGSTAQQLIETLHLPADQNTVRQGYGTLFDSLNANEEVIVRIANKVYAAQGSHVKPPFRQAAVQSFRADAEELDFANKNAESVRAINQWVEQITDNKIKDLIRKLDCGTVMVLVNAIYFKGAWAKAFVHNATRIEAFHTTRTTEIQVPMMHQTSKFSYGAIPNLNARIIELPYVGHRMKMLIILPDEIDGLPAVEEGLNQINFTQLFREMTFGEVILSLPRFRIESEYKLHETLPDMGIRDLFSPCACNLTGITDQQVVVSQVIQKALVEVTEEGTVAAAATAVAMFLSRRRQSSEVFTVDRPFLFILMNSDAILFIGRIT